MLKLNLKFPEFWINFYINHFPRLANKNFIKLWKNVKLGIEQKEFKKVGICKIIIYKLCCGSTRNMIVISKKIILNLIVKIIFIIIENFKVSLIHYVYILFSNLKVVTKRKYSCELLLQIFIKYEFLVKWYKNK